MPMRGDLQIPAARTRNRAAAAEPIRRLPVLDGSDLTVTLSICIVGLSVTLVALNFFPDFAAISAVLDQFP